MAFYPPTNFLTMDAWALQRCEGRRCHDAEESPESRLVGCAIQSCPDKVQAANPARYVSAADPPLMILHGNSDPLVPHNQGEQLYMALNKACRDAIFISLPESPPRELERLPDQRRPARGSDDAVDLRRRLYRDQSHALHTDMEDSHRLPGQVHEEVKRPQRIKRFSFCETMRALDPRALARMPGR